MCAHGAHGELPTVPMWRTSLLPRLGPPSLTTIAGPPPQAHPPLAMPSITARRASELATPRYPPPGSSPGVLHQVIHQGGTHTPTNEDGHEFTSAAVGARAVGRLGVLSVDVGMHVADVCGVDRALEPLCASSASNPPRPTSPLPSSNVPSFPVPRIPSLVTPHLVVCVTYNLAGSTNSVTHTHPICCSAAATTETMCGVDVPLTKFEARRIVGTPTLAMCPHAPATRNGGEKTVGANGHIDD